MLRYAFPLLALLLLSSTTTNGQAIDWLTDQDTARKVALQTGKPILYDFTAKWCGPCRRMESEFWPKPEIVELSKQFVCVKVNFDTQKTLAAKYDIRAIPNVVLTDPWGRGLLGQKGFGAGTESEVIAKMKLVPTDFKELIDAGSKLEADEKNLEALHHFASFYQERKLFWLGNDYYRRLMLVEPDGSKREMIILNLAFNHIRIGEPFDAIEKFQILQKEFPSSGQRDLYIYGLILANADRSRGQEARQLLNELKTKFPKSKYADLAETAVTGMAELKK
jgi:thiol-disulfide isomerase/thioredoxin